MNLIETATRICVVAHEGQKRKGMDALPYTVHPFMVTMKLSHHNFSDTVIAAALTHDVLEDTQYPEEKMKQELGEDVMTIVKTLTQEKNLPWKEVKTKYIEAVRQGSVDAKAVSLADKIHNMESLLLAQEREGKKVWSYFKTGKEEKMWFEHEMLAMLKSTWSHPMIEEYEKLIKKINID